MFILSCNPDLKNYDCGIDTEYAPQIDKPTIPISVQLYIPELLSAKLFIHPQASKKVIRHAKKSKIPVFKHPLALFDYTNWEYIHSPLTPENKHKLLTVNLHHYWSIKDLEYLFSDRQEYLHNFLPFLSKTRRITATRKGIDSKGNFFMLYTIKTNYLVKRINDQGYTEWLRLAFKITDLSAIQGNIGLKMAEINAGMTREETEKLSYEEIINPEQTFINKTERFVKYGLIDAEYVYKLRKNTNDRYNKIAALIGVPEREEFGLTTGRIVGTLLHNAIAVKTGLDKRVSLYDSTTEKYIEMDLLSVINKKSGTNAIAQCANYVAGTSYNHSMAARIRYLSLTDGGRAVRERIVRRVEREELLIDGTIKHGFNPISLGDRYGALVDIDINGCYGNGLKNQLCAVGVPRMNKDVMSFGDFYEKYYKKCYNRKAVKTPKLIPGLWYARITWKNAPFKQDLILSKDKSIQLPTYQSIDFETETNFDSDVAQKSFDSNFCLLTNEVNYGALNHDTVQLLRHFCNRKEWQWICEHAKIEGILYYDSKDERESFPESKAQEIYAQIPTFDEQPSIWIRYEYKTLMEILSNERKKYPKNGSIEEKGMNSFLKLVINTIYGCNASQYFSDPDRTVSNVVIGNNITARARALGWLMAKGFHSYMTITDGGVFDINKVLNFNHELISLSAMEGLSTDNFKVVITNNSKKGLCKETLCNQVPLMYEITSYNEAEKDLESYKRLGKERSDIDNKAWQHLKNQFGGNKNRPIDILDDDQFTFETKDVYVELHLNNKINYTLIKLNGSSFVAYRGFPKIYNHEADKKLTDPRAKELLLALDPRRYDITDKHIIGLKEWLNRNKDGGFLLLDKHEIEKLLLPGDVEQINRVYYSHTPLYMRHANLKEYKNMVRTYYSVRNHYRESYDPEYAQESADAISMIGIDGI